jgi:hypothetical protein
MDDAAWNWATQGFTLIDTTAAATLYFEEPLRDQMTRLPIPFVVDGFRIDFDNPDGFVVNRAESGWTDSSIYDFNLKVYRYSSTQGYPKAADYQIEFGEVGIGTSIELPISATRVLPATPVNFKVKNLTTNTFINFGFYERDALPGAEGEFTAFTDRTRTDEIIFLDDSLGITWQFTLIDASPGESRRNPTVGDKVDIKLDIPFTSTDIFEMTMPDDFSRVETRSNESPQIFQLWQNYPNPFNPATTITFSLPQSAFVTLDVFNALGQKVKTLIHEKRQPAVYRTMWDGTNDVGAQVAAGIYFFRVHALGATETFVDSKKMVFLH